MYVCIFSILCALFHYLIAEPETLPAAVHSAGLDALFLFSADYYAFCLDVHITIM